MLVEQLAEQQQHTDQLTSLKNKTKQLEKDLYYYKKSSRDLRKKLKQFENTDHIPTPTLSVESVPKMEEVSVMQDSLSSEKLASKMLSENVIKLRAENTRRGSSDGSDPDLVGRGVVVSSSGTEDKGRVVRKSRKQLRQLRSGWLVPLVIDACLCKISLIATTYEAIWL